MGLGVVLIAWPGLGAAIFGLAAPTGEDAWVAVVGLRDLAFGLYILALAVFATRRAVGVALGVTVLIPLGDIALLLTVRGAEATGHVLLHMASGAVMAAAALWMLRRGSPMPTVPPARPPPRCSGSRS